jgi:hypothetical protein
MKSLGWLSIVAAVISAVVGFVNLTPTSSEERIQDLIASHEETREKLEKLREVARAGGEYFSALGQDTSGLGDAMGNIDRGEHDIASSIERNSDELDSKVKARERTSTMGFVAAGFFALLSVLGFGFAASNKT